MKKWIYVVAGLLMVSAAEAKWKALIVDGQNNHAVWPKSTVMMKQYLEQSGLFEVEVARTKFLWKAEREKAFLALAGAGESELLKKPKSDPDFSPNFSAYDVVISNFGWKAGDWPEATQRALEQFVSAGGGFVSVHAADNAWPKWKAFNQMIGLGGWGGRTEKDGPYVYYTDEGKVVRDETPGPCGTHGPQHVFPITVREPDHPITRGMPPVWLTAKDECYAKLRGPAEHLTVLATGRDQNKNAPTDRDEPILMVVDYGKGRIFHTTLGHDDYSCEGVGFIVSFLRGTEWAATGAVTQPIPDDFPTAEAPSARPFVLAASSAHPPAWKPLLDPELSQFDVFVGVPHSSVQGLPEGTFQSDKVTRGTPLGLNNDPKHIFSTMQEDGETVLKVSGEIYAGLNTREEYENYHFSTQFKWGEKKWAPRLDQLRDNGILYHCTGKQGAFWKVWKSSVEYQVQETDLGDLFLLAGTSAKVRATDGRYDPSSNTYTQKNVKARVEPDAPHGEWNTLEIYVIGNTAVHVANGELLMVVEDMKIRGTPLTRGQIQIQSEGATCYYKEMKIRSIEAFPPHIKALMKGRRP